LSAPDSAPASTAEPAPGAAPATAPVPAPSAPAAELEDAPAPSADPALSGADESASSTVSAYDETVAAVQQRLVEIGLDPGSTDGADGARTREAIAEYRRFSGAPVSGEPDAALLAALDATLADWRGQGVDESWAVVATPSGPAQGAASGRDRLQAYVEAKQACLTSSGGSGDCRSVRVSAIDADEQCTAFVVEGGTSRKHFGFAMADPLKNASAREVALADARRACGDAPACTGDAAAGTGVVHCTSDFRR